jgi:Uma2 family endonuclease
MNEQLSDSSQPKEGFPCGCQPSVCFNTLSKGLSKPCSEPVPRRFSREEYYLMGEAGVFAPDEHVELIKGEILYMAPQGSSHFTSIRAAEEALRAAFGEGFDIRPQGPLVLGPDSEPEPDIVVVPGSFRDYEDEHPKSALLVVEVSESTLVYDRTIKASLYAAANIAEYWIINLVEDRVEVHRSPKSNPTAAFGADYGQSTRHKGGDVVSPLSAPQASIRVEDLLPRRRGEL